MKMNLIRPLIVESLEEAKTLKREELEDTYDGVVVRGMSEFNPQTAERQEFLTPTGYGDEYVVFETDQIHVLGSKEDTEAFKKFIKK